MGGVDVNADHVVLTTNALHCRHCGDRYEVNMPIDLDVMIAASKAYVDRHRRCPPPKVPA